MEYDSYVFAIDESKVVRLQNTNYMRELYTTYQFHRSIIDTLKRSAFFEEDHYIHLF